MTTENLNMSWSLKELYPSFTGSDFINDLNLLDEKIEELIKWSNENFKNKENNKQKLENYINMLNEYEMIEGRLGAYASLSSAANSSDMEAKKYLGIIEKKSTKLTGVFVQFSKWLCSIEDLSSMVDSSELLTEHSFYFEEIVKQNKYILSEKEEIVISKMRLTSSSSWAKFKNQITSNHMVDIELNGKLESVGINKIKNMYFSKDKEIREKAFYAELKSNEKIAEGVAAALNCIKGEVVTLCELKGYESPLHKTLDDARMDEETLSTMLKVMRDNLGEFKKYFLKKAEILGHKDKLPYYDVMAPVGSKDMNFTYEEAKDFITKHFSSFTKQFGDMAGRAFDNRWIDAEIRDGKRGGAFCHNLHSIKESRILCSYEGSFKNVCTLAHELGHAYHGMILENETPLNSMYPMPLAETASIFTENLVRSAALKIADKEEALVILGAELVNCCSVIVDIYARFLFETELFNRRKESELSPDEIKALMLWAQKEAYGEGIDENTFDPFAWMHKPHYYYVERNFYNFPYAFGLLFSKGLFNMYLNEGEAFVEKYNEVLRLTGRASIYDVAKYVGIDLHDENFWKGSMDMIKKDIDKFCSYK
jgi:pepF/M3 family oligoendopeptidase